MAAIAERRKTDRRAYDRDEALQARERELIEERDVLQEAARGETQVKSVVDAVLGDVSEPGQFESSFDAAFGGLSSDGQEAVRAALRAPVMEASRPASEKAMEAFRGQGPEAAAVLSAWGRSAAKKLATAEARFDSICNGMSETDEKAAVAWFKGLDVGNRAAVVRALAG